MGLLDKIFKKNKQEDLIEINTAITEDADEIAAVISAAIAAMDEEEETVAAITAAISVILGKRSNEFIVRNIKRTSEMDSIWAHEGRMKLIR